MTVLCVKYKNLQGDIIAILNKEAEVIASYSYDAWGACTVKSDTSNCSISTVNPFRYRGYFYDEEIDMYYLQSRYYDAEVGRFINEDDAEFAKISQKIITHNIYAYCCNDPVNGTDVAGRLAAQLIARIILGIMIGILIQLICDLLSYWYSKIFNNPKAFSPSAGDYVSSAISWALTCVTFNDKAIEICAALIPLVIKHVYRAFNKNFDWIDFFIDFLFVLISFLVNKGLDNKKRNNMKKILKKAGNGNKAWNKIRINTKKLNMKVNVWGIKANLGLNISGVFVSNLYSCLYAKYAK